MGSSRVHSLALPLVTLSASFTYPSAHSVRALQGAATRLNQLGHDSWLLVDKVCTHLLAEDPVLCPLRWCLCLLRWCIFVQVLLGHQPDAQSPCTAQEEEAGGLACTDVTPEGVSQRVAARPGREPQQLTS